MEQNPSMRQQERKLCLGHGVFTRGIDYSMISWWGHHFVILLYNAQGSARRRHRPFCERPFYKREITKEHGARVKGGQDDLSDDLRRGCNLLAISRNSCDPSIICLGARTTSEGLAIDVRSHLRQF